jgi:hypothetical protein
MNFSVYFSKNYWGPYLSKKLLLVKSFFTALGVGWLIIEFISFFSSDLSNQIKGNWLFLILFFILLIVWSLFDNRPTLSVHQRLIGRDVNIEICIGDIFDFNGAYVVGSNTTFDTELGNGLISGKSIQGQFTEKYYGDVKHLDVDLDDALRSERYTEITSEKRGKKKEYGIGTVAKVENKAVEAYFLAIASLNQHGVASSSFENIQVSLSCVWNYIANRGGINPLVIPILGSGFSRIEVPRDQIIKEIIRSFVAACATKRFTEKLTIVIHPDDFRKYNLDLAELNEFLTYQCKYTEFKNQTDSGRGTGIN